MYKFLADDPEALGVAILDNTHLVTARADCIRYDIDLDTRGNYATGYGATSDFYPEQQIGWVRTVPPRKDTNIPPYTLFMDKFKRTTLDYSEYFAVPQAIPCRDVSLYKELVTRGAQAVYMTRSGPIFI